MTPETVRPTRPLHPSRRSQVPPFEVMDVLDRVAVLRAEGRDVVSLCAGEPSGGAPRLVSEAAARIHASGRALTYTSALGIRELRAEIAAHYGRWYGLDVDPARVAVTTGSSGGFVLAFLAAFEAGDRVALARPGYPAYRNILTSLGCEVVEIDCGPETRYQPTPALLDAAQAGGPLAGLIVASPANPTGTMVDRAELAAITGWCAANGVRLVSDEIYHGVTYPEPGAADPRGVCAWESDESLARHLLVQQVLGHEVAPRLDAAARGPRAGGRRARGQRLAVPACAGAVCRRVGLRRGVLPRVRRSRRRVRADAETPARQRSPAGVGRVRTPDGAFYYWADLGPQLARWGSSAAYAKALLEEVGVAITPGGDFDDRAGAHSVRLSFAAGTTAVGEAIERIETFNAR